jgi:hypothetical protein
MRSASTIWRMKLEVEASCGFLEGADIVPCTYKVPRFYPTDNGDQPFFAEVNARARQIATAAENAAGAKKKYNPPRMVNAR